MKPRILVVDDDPDTRYVFRLIFEAADYEVDEAPNGLAALGAVKKSRPDLLITDLLMPFMDGLALINRLRSERRTARLPIIAVSGNPDAKEAAARADAVVGKPFDRRQLLDVVRSLLGQTNPEAA